MTKKVTHKIGCYALFILLIAVWSIISFAVYTHGEEVNTHNDKTLCGIFKNGFQINSVQKTEDGATIFWEGAFPYSFYIEFISEGTKKYAHATTSSCGSCGKNAGRIILNYEDYINTYDSINGFIIPTEQDLISNNRRMYTLDNLICGESNSQDNKFNISLDLACDFVPNNKEWSTGRLFMILCN